MGMVFKEAAKRQLTKFKAANPGGTIREWWERIQESICDSSQMQRFGQGTTRLLRSLTNFQASLLFSSKNTETPYQTTMEVRTALEDQVALYRWPIATSDS